LSFGDNALMSDENRPRSSLAVWLIVGLVLLPALYVLSVGPANWLAGHGFRPNAEEWIYWPLGFLAQNVPLVKAFFDWYLPLWGG
jgi:hypothetical protein